ncbi:UDP-3-O-(3-hydroxymyristoyl)glucosamine N-acyltransferase [candidate division WOR-3 bacterium]|nr:UDP-3-O-(3-hydroxymyristoyl)glucosamine N-acyltransferase [candidate division WOR-3 bacterium]
MEGKLWGHGIELKRPAPFAQAKKDELTFYTGDDPGELEKSDAGCVLTRVKPARFAARSLIVVEDVRRAWAKALDAFPSPYEEKAEDLVYVAGSAKVASPTVLLPFTYVGPEVEIGTECVIGPNVTVHAKTRIGSGVRIGAGSVIGSPGFGYITDQDGKHLPINHLGIVVIENDVHIGAGVCIDRGTVSETRIGEGTRIDNLVHIAHNVRIGRNCIITGQCGIAGSAVLEDGVVLAGQSGVKDHVHIGAGAVVYAKSAVFKNVAPGERVSGIPARPHRTTLRAQARLYRDGTAEDS